MTRINEAVDGGDAGVTLAALQQPQVRLFDVDAKQAVHYQNLLAALKREKAEVRHSPSYALYKNESNAVWIDLLNGWGIFRVLWCLFRSRTTRQPCCGMKRFKRL